MPNQRPSPQKLKALRYEIARKYRRKAKVGPRSRSMAAIRLSELTRWLDDSNGAGAELEAGDAGYLIVRIFAHHMGGLPDTSRRIMSWCDRYASWISPRDLERLISEVTSCPLKWSADRLAWKLRLTDAKRTELKIRTIGAIDCNREQRLARRKRLNAEKQKARRAKAKDRVYNI